ncbi:hypothetical protein [Phenylobacterium sp.]|uniref:hypothetical protein n=1 Tax=Phenylobacterium sp. TaxID=1871053 RepID=UPI0025EA9AE7|nr:hypothetical protein [Phenylobacterium sp.]
MFWLLGFGLLALAGFVTAAFWSREYGRGRMAALAICLAPPWLAYAAVTVRLFTADPTDHDQRNFGLDIVWGVVGQAAMTWTMVLAGCVLAGLIWRRIRRARQ